MSKIIFVDRCTECPLFMILFIGEDQDEVYRCQKTDLIIPEIVSSEKELFPVMCPLEKEKP